MFLVASIAVVALAYVQGSTANCTFEQHTLCTWRNVDMNDEFDWTLNSGVTPTGNNITGPNTDHTKGTTDGTYIYIETSKPRDENDTAWLISEKRAASAAGCLTFWYHMYGRYVGSLRVWVWVDSGALTPVWDQAGDKGPGWLEGRVHLPKQTDSYEVIMEGVRGPGYVGDIALDDVSFSHMQPCSRRPDSSLPSVTAIPTQQTTTPGTAATAASRNDKHNSGTEHLFELPPLDGWNNNLLHPEWGAADTQLLRRSKAAYADGVYAPAGEGRPSPLDISQAVHQGPAGLSSYAGRTAMLVYFGQQLVEEIVDSQRPGCPIEYFNIPVPAGHGQFDRDNKGNVHMTFKRTRYDQRTGYSPNNPRQQLNEITPYIDGQVIYGPSKAWTDAIRSFKGGRLAGTNPGNIRQDFPLNNTIRLPYTNPPVAREHVLKPVTRFFRIGNPRGHENPFLLAFGILWFRWHNAEAARIVRENPNLDINTDDEKIFNLARKRVTALYQKIVFYDWLPIWLNTGIPKSTFAARYPYYRADAEGLQYSGYSPSVHPGIYHEFQAAAMRFGHTLVPSGMWRRTGGCEYLPSRSLDTGKAYAAIRLCNAFWNSRESVEEDIDVIFRGMASTIAEREDSILVPDLTDSLFGPLEFSRRDLAAVNIQRGRDHGLADYNTVRAAYGLPRKMSLRDINKVFNRDKIDNLVNLYGGNGTGIDNVDLFTGGLLETTRDGPGELFQRIILDQFLRIRHGDRFWFENTEYSGLSDDELRRIWNTELADVIGEVTGVSTNNDIQRDVFLFRESDNLGCLGQPRQLDPEKTFDGRDMLEPCTPLRHFDYFSGSELSFALTFLIAALCVPVTFLIMYLMSKHRRKSLHVIRSLPQSLQRTASSNANEFRVLEWIDSDTAERLVVVILDFKEHRINVYDTRQLLLRYIDVKLSVGKGGDVVEMHVSSDQPENVLAIKLPEEYDLAMKFFSSEDRSQFLTCVDQFLSEAGIRITRRNLVESYIFRNITTRTNRQEKLEKFFRQILNRFQDGTDDDNMYEPIYNTSTRPSEITKLELTKTEFGEAFGMKPNSTFVEHMFLLADADKSGHVSFWEFLNIFIQLSSDNVDNKIRLLFNMYDIDRRGYLLRQDLYKMVRSLHDIADNDLTDSKVEEFVTAVYRSAGLGNGGEMTYADFKRVFASDEYARTLKNASLELDVLGTDGDQASTSLPSKHTSKLKQRRDTLVKGYSTSDRGSIGITTRGGQRISKASNNSGGRDYNTFLRSQSRRASSLRVIAEDVTTSTGYRSIYDNVVSFIETYRLQVFWMTLYLLVTLGIFLERAFYYAFERENTGLRRIAGHGITITRGAASVVMFTYASLMLTMCRNTFTVLRETVLNRFIPFDSFHSMHKFVACLALFFTVVHVVCHGINLYHVCTQPSTDLNCYFREYFRSSHELASFHYWAYATATGFTGILLTVLVIVMYIFALPYARRHLFHAFGHTHRLYIPTYILLIIHGSARMVQSPHFPWYFLGPAILFTVDTLVTLSRIKTEVDVLKADLLPSDVIALKVKKPAGFEYKSGQWVQVACAALGRHEFHPFTLTSAPQEKTIHLHIRAVGPWTTNLRRVYDRDNLAEKQFPKLYIDGPFGEGHQDWYRYEVSVLIGGGIGVTPFASILKDIVHKSSMDVPTLCQKVYFLWVTRNQKQFEWVADIIRGVESTDATSMVTTHIFVTEFRRKFDLRTTMLYICERHFQKVAGKSLFTGLEATTHFGRPKFRHFLESLRHEHRNVERIGVFSCGPPPMTSAVEKACYQLNKYKRPTYYHHYENF